MDCRSRPRTLDYQALLPYATETREEQLAHLEHIVNNLYIAVEGDDLKGVIGSSSAWSIVHWSRELRSWFDLKFDMPLETRVRLAKLYYHLALSGVEASVMDRFVNMFLKLVEEELLQKKVTPQDLDLDWRLMVKELKKLTIHPADWTFEGSVSKSFHALSKLGSNARHFFSYEATMEILKLILPVFDPAKASISHNVISLLLLSLPATEINQNMDFSCLDLLPSIYHIWALNPRSGLYDFQCLDLVCSLTSDSIVSLNVPFTKYGMLTRDQLSVAFTAILRLLEVPVSFAGSPYIDSSETVPLNDSSKPGPSSRPIAHLIVYSMIGDESLEKDGIMERLENLIHAIETFCHPSNQGKWSKNIIMTVSAMIEAFTMRWNVQLGEHFIPKERHLTEKLRDRFILALRNVAFMGIHSKSTTVMLTSLEALHGLAFLNPDLIIPRLLKEVYPSLQGLVETHRTMSSIKALNYVTRIISQNPRYAFHLTTLLSMAVPGIDPNDLNKTLISLSFVQTAALNVPFYDLSEGQGTGLAMDYVAQDLAHLEDMQHDGQLPAIDPEIVTKIVQSSSSAFADFVRLFVGRVLNLLENLPDSGSDNNDDSPESHVINTIPPTMNALLGAVSIDIYEMILKDVTEFLAGNVISSATDAIAQLCGSLVKVRPDIAFKKLFPILYAAIKYEVEENGAGSVRSREILPRDRALIWNVSALNMALAHAGEHILPYKDQVTEITILMRENCKGSIVFHISNTIHHALSTLSSVFVQDYALVQDENVSIKHWGYQVDHKSVKFSWHVPTETEVQYAYDLYNTHCEISFKNIDAAIASDGTNWTLTQVSDVLFSNLTYLRTSTGGMALLFDPGAEASQPAPSEDEMDIDEEDTHSNIGSDEEDLIQLGLQTIAEDSGILEGDADPDLESDDIAELKKLRTYPVGYFFDGNTHHPLYIKLHQLRHRVGEQLHITHEYLSSTHDNDISSFKALMYAFKVWFSDVGIERSSRQVESLAALYDYDIKYFQVPGLRKDYPRPVLARRLGLYHNERLQHNSGPREPSELENRLLFDVVNSALSIYPDIRRNAQSAMDAAVRVLMRSKGKVYPYILKEVSAALASEEFNRAQSGLALLSSKGMSGAVKRSYKYIGQYVKLLDEALQVDHVKTQTTADAMHAGLMTSLILPVDLIKIDARALEAVRPDEITEHIQKQIDKSRKKKKDARHKAEEALKSLVRDIMAKHNNAHWRLEASMLAPLLCIVASPQFPVEPDVLMRMMKHVPSPNSTLKMLGDHGFIKLVTKVLRQATFDHKLEYYTLWFDEASELRPNQKWLDCANAPDFTERFLEEMNNHQNPEYYVDQLNGGWLVWPDKMAVDLPDCEYTVRDSLSEQDLKVMNACGQMITPDWVKSLLRRNREESAADGDDFDMVNVMVVGMICRVIELGFSQMTLDHFLASIVENFIPDDKNSHRATAEAFAAMTSSLRFSSDVDRAKKLNMVYDNFKKVVEMHLAVDNIGYWRTFVSTVDNIDYRRLGPILPLLMEFRLRRENMEQGFKDSSRLSLLRSAISNFDWSFRGYQGLMDNLWQFTNHALQGVRDEVARLLSTFYRMRYFECYSSVESLLEHNKRAGDLGASGYVIDAEMKESVDQFFVQLEKWRVERDSVPDPSKSDYILACKTILVWLDRTFSSNFGSALVALLPDTILPALLQMLNVRDEQDVMRASLLTIRALGNLAYPLESIQAIIDLIVKLGAASTSTWHQRLALLSYTQAFFFRQFFMMTAAQRQQMVNCVVGMLEDTQLEVRLNAAETLAGLIRCSTTAEQDKLTSKLDKQFTKTLFETQNVKAMPMRSQYGSGTSTPVQQQTLLLQAALNAAGSKLTLPMNGNNKATNGVSGSTTPNIAAQALLIKRHAAVLGLGSLVQAFPYASPPPKWVPEVLATLARKAASDPGMVGKSVKETLGDFKKTRQDTWHIDQQSFSEEQLEDLEGVLWKNYFV